MYTQICISSATEVVLPVMADDSSRRAVQNALSLIYGLKLPSEIYAKYNFAVKKEGREFPKIHRIAKNRLIQYAMKAASAYVKVLKSIDNDLQGLLKSNPEIFTFESVERGTANVRDFNTAGVVAFANGCPFFNLKTGYSEVWKGGVQVGKKSRDECIKTAAELVQKIID